jgi:hypothetical protein
MDYSINKSDKGFNILEVTIDGKQKSIHSKYAPFKENLVFRKKLEGTTGKTICILGLGLGYHLLDNNDILSAKDKVIIIDPLNVPVAALCEDPALYSNRNYVRGYDVHSLKKYLMDLLSDTLPSDLNIIYHTPSQRVYGEYFASVENTILDLLKSALSNKLTKEKFSRLFIKNGLKHIAGLQNVAGVSLLKKRFKSVPAIVLSSAPTLSNCINDIKKAKDSYLVIAVDSAVSALIDNDIVPDFVVSIDPQPWIEEHLLKYQKNCIRFVSSITSYKHSFTTPFTYLTSNTHPLSQILEHLYPGVIGSINSQSGNVAGEAVNLALYLGCSEIYISGIDFAFPAYVSYSRGTAYQNRYAHYLSNRFNTIENQNLNYIFKSSGKLKVDSSLYSRKIFVEYRKKFEENFRDHKKQISLFRCGFSSGEFGNVATLPAYGSEKHKKVILSEVDRKYKPLPIDKKQVALFLCADSVISELSETLYVDKLWLKNKLSTIINNM